MKINLFNAKVLGAALVAAALALGSCSEDKTAGDEGLTPPQDSVETPTEPTLYTAPLATIASSSDRVQVVPQTRADDGAKPGSLTLLASIKNPSEQLTHLAGDSRQLSATSVYYDRTTGTYYATYHMQGNNYNTNQPVETAGLIETFTLDESGTPLLEKIYRSADPEKLDFDFNHLYFDEIPNPASMDYVGTYDVDDYSGVRIIVGGHKSEPTKDGTGTNTAAVIARLNLDDPQNPSIDYSVVYTGEKILDENGKSLGKEDAGDVNCFVRKYNHYYLATRKGIAVVKAGMDHLFEPELDGNGQIYFLKTPGSAKYMSQPTTTSFLDILFLNNDTPEEGLSKETSSPATVVEIAVDTKDGKDLVYTFPNVADFSWVLSMPNKIRKENFASVSPVDGKNMLVTSSNNTSAIYACLGKNGLYVFDDTYGYKHDEILTFSDAKEGGSRPVNGVFVEDWDSVGGRHATDGFIYVANGACLTILDAYTLEQVDEYSAFKEGNASANFVHVVRTDESTNGSAPDRIITVAYGQAGVKVFKFVPPTRF